LLVKQKIRFCLRDAVATAQGKGDLPPVELPEIVIEHPQDAIHGDFACGLPLKLARSMRLPPMNIAHEIAKYLSLPAEIARFAIAKPGFINFTVQNTWLWDQVETILSEGESYGNLDLGKGMHIQVEFVSANPTGPLHVGHGRGAVLGSTLANVLSAAGYQVKKEYYLNDIGTQIDNFRQSLYARYLQFQGKNVALPEEGYMGDYMIALAEDICQKYGDKLLNMPEEKALLEIGQIGLEKILENIKEDLELLGVDFDVWFSEKTLYQEGQYDEVMAMLRNKSCVVEKENAVWIETSSLGEDKDNVLVRGDGSPTYFASDIAYHYDKFARRGFQRVIDIWGADHQGHVPRVKTAMAALGIDPAQLEVITYQLVTLRRGGEIVRLSKRSGDIVTLRELLEEVERDACRFIFLSRSADSQMDFDVELAKRKSADNPVYYVQYAHARIASILRLAEQKNIQYNQGDVSLLTSDPEMTLIRILVLLPETVEIAATALQPHYLTYYAQDMATVFHSFYKQCRVISNDRALTQSRLKLVEATKIVLSKTLHLMGMGAPEKM
jgi:arginyl-tRNA synthetase